MSVVIWPVVRGARPGDVGVIGAHFTNGDDRGGPWRRGVVWETDGAEVGLASDISSCIFGIDTEPIFIPRRERGERMARGRLGQNGRGYLVGCVFRSYSDSDFGVIRTPNPTSIRTAISVAIRTGVSV